MKNIKYIITTLSLLFVFNVQAGWWIFGNSKAEIDYKYMTFNGVNWDELDQKFKIYPDMIPDGITVEGKAWVSKGKVGSVRISIQDGKWQATELSDDGTFKFFFKPRRGTTYSIKVEISDTAGKTNDIEATKRTVEVTRISAKNEVKKILKNMNVAYKTHNLSQFMKHVSKQFLGDQVMLEDALRQDFTMFSSIKIDLIPVSFNFKDDLRVEVDVKYIRTMLSKTSSKILADSGLTRFTFKLGATGLELFSMKFPIIFGLSDAANIASGFVRPGGNPNTLIVDDDEPKKVPFNSAMILIGSGASVVSGMVSVVSFDGGIDTLSFGSESVSRESHSDFANPALAIANIETGDIAVGHLYFRGKAGTMIKKLSGSSVDIYNEVPTTGYVAASGVNVSTGSVYAVRTTLGKYALMVVSGFSLVGSVTHYTITYKFQTNGTNKF